MVEIIFEDPPESNEGPLHENADHKVISRALMNFPNRWAIVHSYSSLPSAVATAVAVKSGALAAYRNGRYEALGRTVKGEHRLYVKYIGPSLRAGGDRVS